MNVIICKDEKEVAKKAFELVEKVLKSKENPVLGLATGSTPLGLYNEMVKAYQNKEISYQNVVTYNLDEYIGLAKDHPESYYSFMHTNLFDKTDFKESNIHIPEGSNQQDALKYEDEVVKGQVDLQILGIGRNGHIGFNEPNTPFDSITHIVDLTQETIEDNARFFDGDKSLVPTKAITMGIGTIMHAKEIVLIALGSAKADCIKDTVEGAVSEQTPASILQKHPNATIILDELAAAKLAK